MFNSLADRNLNCIEKLLVICRASREREIVQLSILAYHCVEGQDFEGGSYVEFAGEVEVEVNGTVRPFASL